MEENRDYHAYRYGDYLTPGSELKIEHSVVCENVDISTLITMGTAGSGNTDDQPGFGISSYTGDRTYRQSVERHR